MNIVLIGYRGAGKSTVGRSLGARLGKTFVDTDELIEKREGSSIQEIVTIKGWKYFRILEKETVQAVSREDQLIIAPGGGAILDDENVASLKEKGLIIWLKAEGPILWERIIKELSGAARRPSLTGKGTQEEFEEVLTHRKSLYEKAADAIIDTATLSTDKVVESVLQIIRQGKENEFGR